MGMMFGEPCVGEAYLNMIRHWSGLPMQFQMLMARNCVWPFDMV